MAVLLLLPVLFLVVFAVALVIWVVVATARDAARDVARTLNPVGTVLVWVAIVASILAIPCTVAYVILTT